MDHRPRRSAAIPIELSTTFEFDAASYADIADNEGLGEAWYGRFGNPTGEAAAREVAALEGAEAGAIASSGMGAIATTLISLLRAGDRIVAADEIYGDTRTLLERDLAGLGVDVVFVPVADVAGWEQAVGGGSGAVWRMG